MSKTTRTRKHPRTCSRKTCTTARSTASRSRSSAPMTSLCSSSSQRYARITPSTVSRDNPAHPTNIDRTQSRDIQTMIHQVSIPIRLRRYRYRRRSADTKNELVLYLGDKQGMKGGCHVYQPYWHRISTRGNIHRIKISEVCRILYFILSLILLCKAQRVNNVFYFLTKIDSFKSTIIEAEAAAPLGVKDVQKVNFVSFMTLYREGCFGYGVSIGRIAFSGLFVSTARWISYTQVWIWTTFAERETRHCRILGR
jgi:hypothetical protein